jgi:hypothetical protein
MLAAESVKGWLLPLVGTAKLLLLLPHHGHEYRNATNLLIF